MSAKPEYQIHRSDCPALCQKSNPDHFDGEKWIMHSAGEACDEPERHCSHFAHVCPIDGGCAPGMVAVDGKALEELITAARQWCATPNDLPMGTLRDGLFDAVAPFIGNGQTDAWRMP